MRLVPSRRTINWTFRLCTAFGIGLFLAAPVSSADCAPFYSSAVSLSGKGGLAYGSKYQNLSKMPSKMSLEKHHQVQQIAGVKEDKRKLVI